MNQQENTTEPNRRCNAADVRLIVGTVQKTVLADEGTALPLWMAVALDGDGCAAALGLYKGPPTVGEVMRLLADEPVDADELGPQWTCPGAGAVIVDHAVLWHADEMRGRLAARGISVYALAPAGRDRDRTDKQFSVIAKSLAAALRRDADHRDGMGAALITPHAAIAAAREWRAAAEAVDRAG